MNALLASLAESELALVRETERDRLATLDEDALAELHTRVRRARDKFVGMYRREASARIAPTGGRGKARPRNARNAMKAEVFEDALSRVSRSLAAAARHSAADLKAERIEAARSARGTGRPTNSRQSAGQRTGNERTGPTSRSPRTDRRPDSPALRKRNAATRSKGAVRQATRDSR